jgi:hypothetical protein
MAKSYVAHYELDAQRHWSVYVKVSSGIAVSHGRTLAAARKQIRRALALLLECRERDLQIEDKIELPSAIQKSVKRALAARSELQRRADEAESSTRNAARRLRAAGVSLPDAGEVLGLSKQRVHQILSQ